MELSPLTRTLTRPVGRISGAFAAALCMAFAVVAGPSVPPSAHHAIIPTAEHELSLLPLHSPITTPCTHTVSLSVAYPTHNVCPPRLRSALSPSSTLRRRAWPPWCLLPMPSSALPRTRTLPASPNLRRYTWRGWHVTYALACSLACLLNELSCWPMGCSPPPFHVDWLAGWLGRPLSATISSPHHHPHH